MNEWRSAKAKTFSISHLTVLICHCRAVNAKMDSPMTFVCFVNSVRVFSWFGSKSIPLKNTNTKQTHTKLQSDESGMFNFSKAHVAFFFRR